MGLDARGRLVHFSSMAIGERNDWTDDELDLIIADYFLMLNDEAVGVSFNKAQHNQLLRNKIDRSRASIEFKHRNISAVLEKLCLPRIRGYAPAANYQGAIVAAIDRYISQNPAALHPERVAALQNAPVCSSSHHPLFCLSLLAEKISNA